MYVENLPCYRHAVSNHAAGRTHLVRALTKAGAINRIAEQTITAKVPTQDELLACAAVGMPILNANAASTA